VLVISLFEYIEKHWKRVDSRGQPHDRKES
jgi:hypothetical protein